MMASSGNANAAGKGYLVPVARPGQPPAELAQRMQERYDPNTKKAKPGLLDKIFSPTASPKTMPKTEPVPEKPRSSPKKENGKKEKTSKEKDKSNKEKTSKEKVKVTENKKAPPCRLTRKQLGLDETTFARLDANKDGILDNAELAAFVQRSPDVSLVVSFGDKADKPLALASVVGRPAALADKIHLQDAVSMLDLGATRMELRRSAEKKRYNRLQDLVKQQLTALFKAADKDNNGYIDEKEAKGNGVIGGFFKQMDRDGDGKVTVKEILTYLDDMSKLQERATEASVTLVLRDQSRGLFDLLDTNRDGRLSVREIKRTPTLLAKLGRQDRGYLEAKDIPHSYQLTLRRGAAEAGFNQEAFFAERYFGGGSREETATAHGPNWFRKMDRNRDGDVSRKEFLFSAELFRKIDTDGDGLISLEEAEKAGDLSRN